MKKFSTSVLIFLLLFSFFATFAYAHPGRTDSRGGHYDSDTGEYHYHSGEYAGQNQSSNSSSSQKYNSYDPDIWQERGLDDGLRQLCEDTIYKNSFTEGFNNAAEEYLKDKPILKRFFKNDSRDIFKISFYSFDLQFSYVRIENYKKHFSDSYTDYYDNLLVYIDNYTYSYEHGSVANAPIAYKYSEATKQIRKAAYQDGYDYFYDSCLYAYKENYPLESFLTTLPLSLLIPVLLALVFIITIILFLRWVKKSRQPKITIVEESVLETQPTEPTKTAFPISIKDIENNINFFENLKNQFSSPELLTNKPLLLSEEAQSLIRPVGEEIKEIFIRKYTGVPISSFIKLPPSIKHIDKNGHIFYNDSHSTYGDYSVYVSDSGKVLHKTKWCSNAWRELNYLNLSKKYNSFKKCQRCFDIVSSYKIEKNEWFEFYKKIVLRKAEYGIDEISFSDIFSNFSSDEQQFILRQKSKKTQLPHKKEISKNVYIVGKDIPFNKTYFSPIDEGKPAFISIRTESNQAEYDFPIFKNKQYITLMEGEKIELVNCYFDPEDL